MEKTLTQLPLDFGPEPEVPSQPSVGGDGAGDQDSGRYMAAAGVGVRVKSYKSPVTPVAANGELFPAVAKPLAVEPVAAEQTAVESIAVAPIEVEQAVVTAAEPAVEAIVEVPAAVAEPRAVSGEPQATLASPTKKGRRATTGRAGTAVAKTGPSKRGRKSLKQVAAEADLIEIPGDEVLFSKQYYTMGEVAEMFRVNQSLLRFWESEFDVLQPRKNKKGDRYFRPVDIKNLHLIYHLLRQKKYTIEGAKEFLKKNKKADERFEVIKRLQEIKAFLLEWKAQL
jgi:DNA-binding transcriptional MerR regulator